MRLWVGRVSHIHIDRTELLLQRHTTSNSNNDQLLRCTPPQQVNCSESGLTSCPRVQVCWIWLALQSRRRDRGVVSARRPRTAPDRTVSNGNVPISAKDEQPAKASLSILVREGGSVISIKDEHPLKANRPITARAAKGGSVISVKDAQSWKAPIPISARAGGSVISAKDAQPLKAHPRRGWAAA